MKHIWTKPRVSSVLAVLSRAGTFISMQVNGYDFFICPDGVLLAMWN